MSGLYKNKDELMFDKMYQIFLFSSKKFHKKKSEIIKVFFVETETINRALEEIVGSVNSNSPEMHFALEEIMDSNLTRQLVKYYMNGKIDENLYIWYARRQPFGLVDWGYLK